MIIPIKCFTCGTVIANKYRYYQAEVRKLKGDKTSKVTYLTNAYQEKTAEGITLDNMGIKKMCCRRHFMTHVDID